MATVNERGKSVLTAFFSRGKCVRTAFVVLLAVRAWQPGGSGERKGDSYYSSLSSATDGATLLHCFGKKEGKKKPKKVWDYSS